MPRCRGHAVDAAFSGAGDAAAAARQPPGLGAGTPRPGFRAGAWLGSAQLRASEVISLRVLLARLPALRLCWLMFTKAFERGLLARGSNRERQL